MIGMVEFMNLRMLKSSPRTHKVISDPQIHPNSTKFLENKNFKFMPISWKCTHMIRLHLLSSRLLGDFIRLLENLKTFEPQVLLNFCQSVVESEI